jgi:predicted AAA+ superfamily ATPase
MDYLKENGINSQQIIYINFEDMNFANSDNNPPVDYDGIKSINALEWLMG